MATLLTTDLTFQYGDTGQILNTDPSGTNPFCDITTITGLSNAPVRLVEHAREGMDGGFIDASFENMRVITLEGSIFNVTETFLDALKANYAPSNSALPFYFQIPVVGVRVVFAKSLGITYALNNLRRLGQVAFQIQLKAEDPTIYGPQNTGTANIGGSSTGFGFPLRFPLGFGGVLSNNGTISINNSGNKPADATFVIYGPITNPAIYNSTTGQKVTFNITLGATDYLTVNLMNKTVILNGTTNRRGTMLGTSTWFLLQPGINAIALLGTPGGTPPTMTFNTRPAYR